MLTKINFFQLFKGYNMDIVVALTNGKFGIVEDCITTDDIEGSCIECWVENDTGFTYEKAIVAYCL